MAAFEAVLRLDELRPGTMHAVMIAGREILLCRTRAGVFALDNICTHAHARMCEGRLRSLRVICPMHGASFDVRDGRVLGPPAVCALGSYPTRVVEGVIEVGSEEERRSQQQPESPGGRAGPA